MRITNLSFLRAASLSCLLASGGCGGQVRRVEEATPTSSDEFIAMDPIQEEGVPTTYLRGELRLKSEITVQDFFNLHQDSRIKYLIVIFHAEWCEPCKRIETSASQQRIQDLNRTNPGIRIVTMDYGHDIVISGKNFVFQFDDMTAVHLPGLPAVFYVENSTGNYYAELLSKVQAEDPFLALKAMETSKFKMNDRLPLPKKARFR